MTYRLKGVLLDSANAWPLLGSGFSGHFPIGFSICQFVDYLSGVSAGVGVVGMFGDLFL